MANKVIVKKNSSSGNVPGSSDIDVGELAVNTADAKIFTKHTDGTIQTLGKDVADEATALAIALG
jgi:hypothetical protein